MVLEVREKNGRKYDLMLDGEVYGRCYPGDLRLLGGSDGSDGQEREVSADMLVEFERTVFLPRAKKRSLMLLGKKEYTSREMIKKLTADGYPESVVINVMDWLSELHYVDDRSYAERYAFHLLSGYSEREIVQKMQRKGLEKELIKDAVDSAKVRYREEYSDITADGELSPEQEAIRSFLRKKGYRSEITEEEKKKKLVMALYRKGFLLSDIRAVLGAFDDEYEE